jgi:hypothetical protein
MQVDSPDTVEGFFMASAYDALTDPCTALAAKTSRKSDKLRLLKLAD